MRRTTTAFLLFAACLLCSTAQADTTSSLHAERIFSSMEGEALLKQASETLNGLRSLKTDFVQERHLSIFEDILRATGACWFQTPDLIRWEIFEPYASVLIHNDGKVAKFEVENGRLRKMQLGAEDVLKEVLEQIMDWMRGDFSRSKDTYRFEFREGRDYEVILRPKSEDMAEMIESVDIAMSTETLHVRRVTIREPQGDFVEIRFLNEVLNPNLDPALFDLREPKRVRR
ncbi:outer membrane lipoprotein carrier protein LolA [bacterium]|nr:outer membrane lipoprotein carrier protein LolA [bacterium]